MSSSIEKLPPFREISNKEESARKIALLGNFNVIEEKLKEKNLLESQIKRVKKKI